MKEGVICQEDSGAGQDRPPLDTERQQEPQGWAQKGCEATAHSVPVPLEPSLGDSGES